MKPDIEKKAFMIDEVAALDLPSRKIVRQLYEAAFQIVDKPLCLAAAEKIATKTSRGDSVFILTGFPIISRELWETDGPLGATVLAETLRLTGLKPLLITDNACVEILRAISSDTRVLGFPVDNKEAKLEAEKLVSEFNPSMLIAIERPGWNGKHVYHNMKGRDISDLVGKTDYLFILVVNLQLRLLRLVMVEMSLGAGQLQRLFEDMCLMVKGVSVPVVEGLLL